MGHKSWLVKYKLDVVIVLPKEVKKRKRGRLSRICVGVPRNF